MGRAAYPRAVDVPSVAVELFAGPPETFVARRDALAKRLRGEGRVEESKAVKRLRRPTAAAHAVNVLVREAPDLVNEVMTAAAALATAQRRALSGLSGTDLRGAVRAHNQAIDGLMAAVPEVAAMPANARDDVRRTLHAAALDDDLAARVVAGVLSTAAAAPDASAALTGFGALAVVPDPVDDGPAAHEDHDGRRDEAGVAVEEEGRAEEEAAAREAERRAAAERALIRARAAVDEGRAVSSAAVARASSARDAAVAAALKAERTDAAAVEAMRRAEALRDAADSAAAAATDAAARAEELSRAVARAASDLAAREEALAGAEAEAEKHRP